MDDAQARTGGAVVEIELDPFLLRGALDEAVAELLGHGAHLPQIALGDPAAELGNILAHESRQNTNLDTLVEIGAPGRETKPQSIGEVDVVHVTLFTLRKTGQRYDP